MDVSPAKRSYFTCANVWWKLLFHSTIDNFEEQLVGAHPGDKVEVTVVFPDDYQAADLAGKEAVFDVTVNGIYE